MELIAIFISSCIIAYGAIQFNSFEGTFQQNFNRFIGTLIIVSNFLVVLSFVIRSSVR